MKFEDIFYKYEKLALDEIFKSMEKEGFIIGEAIRDYDTVHFTVNTIPMYLKIRNSSKTLYLDKAQIFNSKNPYVNRSGIVGQILKTQKEMENFASKKMTSYFKSVDELKAWFDEFDFFKHTAIISNPKLNKLNDKTNLFENIYNMKHLMNFSQLNEAYRVNNETGKLEKIPDTEWQQLMASGQAKKISLKEAFPGPVKSPYVGLVIKTNDGYWGVIVDVFQRNDDWLFDIYLKDGEVKKNLSWNRDYKIAYGDRIHGWYPFGEDGVPNNRHGEIIELLDESEDVLGINLGVAKPENLN